MYIRMGSNQRDIGEVGHIPEAFFIQVREITRIPSSLQPRTRALPAGVRPGPVSGERGKVKWNAISKGIGPAPHNPQGTKASLVKVLEGHPVGGRSPPPPQSAGLRRGPPLSKQAESWSAVRTILYLAFGFSFQAVELGYRGAGYLLGVTKLRHVTEHGIY